MCVVDSCVYDSNDDVVAAFGVVPGIVPIRSVSRDCFDMPLLEILFRQDVHFRVEFCLFWICLDKERCIWKRAVASSGIDAPSSK